MVQKNTRYNVLTFVWGLLIFGATVAVFSGKAAPLLTPSTIPVEGPLGLFVFAGGLFLAGALLTAQLKKRAWKRAGQRANLTPDGGGLFGKPNLVGTRAGRTVTARTVKRKTGSRSSEGGSNHTTYTVVEADLDDPATEGIVVGVGDSEETEFGEMTTEMETTAVGDFETVTDAPDRAQDLLNSKTQRALAGPGRVDSVLVGDASSVLLDALPDGGGMLMGKMADAMKTKIEKQFPGDADSVTIQTSGVLLDGAELDEQVDAVATVANEFEATARR